MLYRRRGARYGSSCNLLQLKENDQGFCRINSLSVVNEKACSFSNWLCNLLGKQYMNELNNVPSAWNNRSYRVRERIKIQVWRRYRITNRCREAIKIGSFSKPQRRRQRERHQTKGLKSRTIAVHVRFESFYISLLSSAKQQREMTKFYVFWRTRTAMANFWYLL